MTAHFDLNGFSKRRVMKQTKSNSSGSAFLAAGIETGTITKTVFPVSFPLPENKHTEMPGQHDGRLLPAKPVFENKFLSSLEPSSLLELLPFMERVNLSPNEFIFYPERKVKYIYFPETSVVSEIQILEDGRTLEIAQTGRESVVGLPSVFAVFADPECERAANWSQTVIGGGALKIDIRTLRAQLEKDGFLRETIFEHINSYIRQLSQRVICHSYHSVEERFSSWLLMLYERSRGESLPLTQETMARLLGVHRPSLTHIARRLRERKTIEYTRGRIHLRDREKLEVYSCKCHLH